MLRKSLALAIAALVCGLPLSAASQQKDKIAAAEAFQPLAKSACPLVKK